MVCVAFAQLAAPARYPAVIVSTDTDCVVGIDDKVAGRIERNHKELFPTAAGTHTLSAATSSGDYWEQSVDIKNGVSPSIEISFVKVREQRADLELAVSLARRRSVVEAINYYSDRWGKEMGLSDSRNQSSQNLNDAIEDQSWKNLGNPNQTAQGIGNMIMFAEMLRANHLKKKALKNSLAQKLPPSE